MAFRAPHGVELASRADRLRVPAAEAAAGTAATPDGRAFVSAPTPRATATAAHRTAPRAVIVRRLTGLVVPK